MAACSSALLEDINITVEPAFKLLGTRAGGQRYNVTLSDTGEPVTDKPVRLPFFDTARILIAAGYDPDATLIMRWKGSEVASLTGRLGRAAELTVKETVNLSPRIAPWSPFDIGEPAENPPPAGAAGALGLP